MLTKASKSETCFLLFSFNKYQPDWNLILIIPPIEITALYGLTTLQCIFMRVPKVSPCILAVAIFISTPGSTPRRCSIA